MIADRARRHLTLSGDQSGRLGTNEVADEVDVVGGYSGSASVADDVSQFDEGARRRCRRFLIQGVRLRGFFVSGAQPDSASERNEHGVGDDRCCCRSSSSVDVEGGDSDPQGTDDLADRIIVFAQRSVSLRGRQDAGEQTLDEETTRELVVGSDRHERSQQLLPGGALTSVRGGDDLIEIVHIAESKRRKGRELDP